jgi:hypothetical protein
MSDRVLLEIRDRVAYVTLNRAQKYNGLDRPMPQGLARVARPGDRGAARALLRRRPAAHPDICALSIVKFHDSAEPILWNIRTD